MESGCESGITQYLTGGNDPLSGAAQDQNLFPVVKESRKLLCHVYGCRQWFLRRGFFPVMLTVLLPKIFRDRPMIGRQAVDGCLDSLEGGFILAGIATRADAPAPYALRYTVRTASLPLAAAGR